MIAWVACFTSLPSSCTKSNKKSNGEDIKVYSSKSKKYPTNKMVYVRIKGNTTQKDNILVTTDIFR